ncbi:hypothetical protein ON010_g2631 [Phytophthora cinnamomi]|nr:hypothetical protein ON010_g2631 [Phytophthora cinnamomi]
MSPRTSSPSSTEVYGVERLYHLDSVLGAAADAPYEVIGVALDDGAEEAMRRHTRGTDTNGRSRDVHAGSGW